MQKEGKGARREIDTDDDNGELSLDWSIVCKPEAAMQSQKLSQKEDNVVSCVVSCVAPQRMTIVSFLLYVRKRSANPSRVTWSVEKCFSTAENTKRLAAVVVVEQEET